MFIGFTAAVRVFAAISLATTVVNATGQVTGKKDETVIATCVANNVNKEV